MKQAKIIKIFQPYYKNYLRLKAMSETQPKIFEVDQIVSAGINGHPRFFRVVRLTAKTAWFQELIGQLVEHDLSLIHI